MLKFPRAPALSLFIIPQHCCTIKLYKKNKKKLLDVLVLCMRKEIINNHQASIISERSEIFLLRN